MTAEEEQSEDSVIAESVVAALGFEPTRPLSEDELADAPSAESVDAIVNDLLSGDELDGDEPAEDEFEDADPLTEEANAEDVPASEPDAEVVDVEPELDMELTDDEVIELDDVSVEDPTIDLEIDEDADDQVDTDAPDATGAELSDDSEDAVADDVEIDVDGEDTDMVDDDDVVGEDTDKVDADDHDDVDVRDAVDAEPDELDEDASDASTIATSDLFDKDTPAVDAIDADTTIEDVDGEFQNSVDEEPVDEEPDADVAEASDGDADAADVDDVELALEAPGTDGLFPDLPGPADELDDFATTPAPDATDVLAPGALPDLTTPVEAPLVESPAVAATAAASAAAPAGRRFGRRRRLRARKVRRVVRHIDPWSVLTFSVLFHLALFTALLLAGVLLWNAAIRAGTVERVESFIEQIGDYEAFEIDSAQIFRSAVIIGATLTLASSVLLVLLTVVFNLISDLIGGIRVTVIEEETVQLRPKKRRRSRSDPPSTAESG